MANSTSNTYQMKRKILTFTNKISRHLEIGTPAFAAASYLQQVKKWCLQPVSIYSRIHSSSEKDYKSVNAITFQAMEQGAALFGKATFAMARGYDDNKMFLKLDELGQDDVIRLTAKRKLLYHNKWTMATELRNRRKGKVKVIWHFAGRVMFMVTLKKMWYLLLCCWHKKYSFSIRIFISKFLSNRSYFLP